MPVIVIAGLGVIIIAIFALIIMLATGILTQFLNQTIGKLPYVGSYVAHVVETALSPAGSALTRYADPLAVGVGDAFFSVAVNTWTFIDQAITTVDGIVTSIGATWDHADTLYNDSIKYTEGAITNLGDTVDNLYNKAIAYADGLYNDAVAWTNDSISTLAGQVDTLYNKANAYADGLYNDAVAWTNQSIGTLAGQVDTLYNKAIAYTDTTVEALSNALTGTIATTVNDALSDLETSAHDIVSGPWEALLPTIQSIVAHFPQAIPGAILPDLTIPDVAPTTIAGILSGVLAITAPLAVEIDQCGLNMCENLSGLANLFADLTDVGLLGALLALLTECATDPAQAVTDVTSLAAPIVDSTASAMRALVNV